MSKLQTGTSTTLLELGLKIGALSRMTVQVRIITVLEHGNQDGKLTSV